MSHSAWPSHVAFKQGRAVGGKSVPGRTAPLLRSRIMSMDSVAMLPAYYTGEKLRSRSHIMCREGLSAGLGDLRESRVAYGEGKNHLLKWFRLLGLWDLPGLTQSWPGLCWGKGCGGWTIPRHHLKSRHASAPLRARTMWVSFLCPSSSPEPSRTPRASENSQKIYVLPKRRC